MVDVAWTHPALPYILGTIPKEMKSLIDVGCGRGIIGALCRIYREPSRLVGMDVYESYLQFCKQFKFYDEYGNWNLEKPPLPFKNREFDVATCIEVIEHLPKDSGGRLLDELERIATRIIVTTPNIFSEQATFDNNPYQEHVSLWRVRDFRRRHYKVYGVGEMKIFGRTIKYISSGFGPMTRYIPHLSTLLLCIKDNSKSNDNAMPHSLT